MQPGRVYTVDELLGTVWGAEFVGQPQVVYVHIRWLREKIELDANHPQRIVTVGLVIRSYRRRSNVSYFTLTPGLESCIAIDRHYPDHRVGVDQPN